MGLPAGRFLLLSVWVSASKLLRDKRLGKRVQTSRSNEAMPHFLLLSEPRADWAQIVDSSIHPRAHNGPSSRRRPRRATLLAVITVDRLLLPAWVQRSPV